MFVINYIGKNRLTTVSLFLSFLVFVKRKDERIIPRL